MPCVAWPLCRKTSNLYPTISLELEYLHRKSISCALIQETHLKQSDVARFQNKYYNLIAFSCAQNKTKGVLILVNRKLNLTIEHIGSDEKGRFVLSDAKYIIIG